MLRIGDNLSNMAYIRVVDQIGNGTDFESNFVSRIGEQTFSHLVEADSRFEVIALG